MNPARLSTPPGRQPTHDGGGNLARVMSSSAGHFLFVSQPPQNVGADGTDISEPCIRHASPWVLRWAGAAYEAGCAITQAKSLPLFSFEAQINHVAHSTHSAVGASESAVETILDAEKFNATDRKVIRHGGKHDG